MARPKNWSFTPGVRALAEVGASVVKVGVGAGSICTTRVVSGAGSFVTGCSASSTIDRILSQGVVSAHWTERVAFSTGTAATFTGPTSGWRFTIRSSGAATFELMALQAGPERVA